MLTLLTKQRALMTLSKSRVGVSLLLNFKKYCKADYGAKQLYLMFPRTETSAWGTTGRIHGFPSLQPPGAILLQNDHPPCLYFRRRKHDVVRVSSASRGVMAHHDKHQHTRDSGRCINISCFHLVISWSIKPLSHCIFRFRFPASFRYILQQSTSRGLREIHSAFCEFLPSPDFALHTYGSCTVQDVCYFNLLALT